MYTFFIFSPSLFQRPVSPQMSSTQFEWTIDEVSSLKPANVEPHETQFQDSPNPEFEAKAQLAISSYFKDNQIVPSPVDCPLRSNRIILSEMNGNTPISKPGRRIKDSASQTELTLPPILPLDLEEALKPYFQPHLAGSCIELQRKNSNRSFFSTSSEGKDTSLRRKLFDLHNIIVVENESHNHFSKISDAASNHSNSSPISLKSVKHNPIVGKLSDSLDKSSFGSLSPISATEGLSPSVTSASATKRRTHLGSFRAELEELLSPIHPPSVRKSRFKSDLSKYRSQCCEITIADSNMSQEAEDNDNFTPERSSSPLISLLSGNTLERTSESFNVKISQLKVNTSKSFTKMERSKRAICNTKKEEDIFMCNDDTDDVMENTTDMDDYMQISQLSTHSSNCSSSQSDTPRGKKRSASRKNLSQSFSTNYMNEADDGKGEEFHNANQIQSSIAAIPSVAIETTANTVGTTPDKKSLNFYRTDSGFNELSQNFSSCDATVSRTSQENNKDMVSSTPSKSNAF